MELISTGEWSRAGSGRDLLIDLRNPVSFRRGHLSGAVCLPYEKRERWMSSLPREKRIVLICERGTTAIQTARLLDARGYRTAVIAGGYHQLRLSRGE